ncbi:MAG: hypothetical protein ACK4UT_00940 [Moraxellaceae bacterium]
MTQQMLTTADIYTAVKALIGKDSAYAVAKVLGASNQAALTWRDGRHVMDDARAIKAAQMLGWDADYVLACLAAERAERADHADTAAVWRHVALRLATAASAGFLGIFCVLLSQNPVL